MTIGASCGLVAKYAEDAVAWSRSAQGMLGARAPHVTRQAERALDVARKLERAASLPSAVGVFGPSQVGKSYLINALAKGDRATLKVKLGNDSYDFLTDINPPGGGTEATGIVTRFTLTPNPDTISDHPIRVRLHTVADLVKVIANTYYSDFSANELDQADVPTQDHLDHALNGTRGGSPLAGKPAITARDVDWIRAYIGGRFGYRKMVAFLESSDYWRDVGAAAESLSVDACAKVFGIVWGGHSILTDVFLDLARALEQLGFADAVYCKADALIPRDTSILDATNLYHIGRPDVPKIGVSTAEGAKVQVALSSLSAIVAELQLQIEDQAHGFQSHTDVLDFPGARSRHSWHDPSVTLKEPKKLGEALLRGKVAYLFERFTEDFMLNSLVFCVQPGNQEVKTVSDYLSPWVLSVHGRTPEDRANVDVGLFVALTFFDERFQEAEGGDMSWHDALRTSLVDLLNDRHNWVEAWTTRQQFSNTFWIRNPSYKARGLLTYDGNTETGLLDPERIATFKSEYLKTELVRRHIEDAEDRFDAGLELNDGGIGYLAERLGRVCTADLKDRQIAIRLKANLQDLQTELTKHYVPIEGGEEVARLRVARADETLRGLAPALLQSRFGHLLSDLTVQHEEIVAALSRLDRSQQSLDTAPLPSMQASQIDDLLGHILDSETPTDANDASQTFDSPAHTSGYSSALAQRAIDCWTDKILRQAGDPAKAASYGVTSETMSHVAEELISGLMTSAFKSRLVERLDGLTLAAEASRARVERTASVSSEFIGSYVNYLDQNWLAPADRAKGRNNEGLFSRAGNGLALEERDLNGQDIARSVFVDWCTAFKALVERNANAGASASGNTPENKALGALLTQIKTKLSAS